jgi:hypothetical protein
MDRTHRDANREYVKPSRIKTEADLETKDKWDEYFDWLFNYGERFHDTFGNRIQRFEHL